MLQARPPRQPRRALHGVLLLDKPLGWTSNDALQKCKGLLRAEKGGHTGTLDPLATGLLPLCFGAATKFSQASLDADKRYTATLKLGQTTSTGDREGEVTATRPVTADRAAIEAACTRFVGDIDQTPPMHSALKHEGKALYDYARAGIEVERASREVRIYKLNMVLTPADQAPSAINIIVTCSKGTYIRTLGEDIGQALGCGAHLSALRRLATGRFDESQCITLERLEAMDEGARLACLLAPDALLQDHEPITLDREEAGRFLSGLRRRGPWGDAEHVAVYGQSPRSLLGTAHVKAGELIPTRLMSPLELQQMLATSTL